MSLLTVSNIYKKYHEGFLLKDISLTQQRLQKIAIAGETGSGKTTLMRIIAGLGQADSGEVFFEQARVKGVNEKLMPGHPGIAYLSQHFELNNNYRVAEVLAYADKLTDEESATLYDVCRISHLLERKTNTLSGGEKQRVALARLLTFLPRLLLLDEPFSNMDLIHKNILKSVIDDIGKRLGVTCMLISHDPQDILPWADEILVMKHGEIIQRSSPQQIYQQPLTAYTAGLFGKYNLLETAFAAALPGIIQGNVFIRPEDISIVDGENNGIKGIVTNVAYLGSNYELEIAIEDHTLTVKTNAADIVQGDIVYVRGRKL